MKKILILVVTLAAVILIIGCGRADLSEYHDRLDEIESKNEELASKIDASEDELESKLQELDEIYGGDSLQEYLDSKEGK